MTEQGNFIPFRESVSQAPEFKEPFKASILGKPQSWPFQEVKSDKNSSVEKVVFEAKSSFTEDMDMDPLLVRVSYEEPYGLEAKRTIVLRKFSNSELLMISGEIKYGFGEVDILIASNLNGPFETKEIVSDPENFKPTIMVVAAGDKPIPPVAYMEHHFSSRIPINVEFPHADFEEALNGEVEKREKQGFNTPSYKKTYFQWEELAGAKVGITKYDDPTNLNRLNYYRWFTKINNREPVQLEDSPYKEKISWSQNRRGQWGSGRLRFSRINSQTGETWMLSVPEWIDKQRFHDSIQSEDLMGFFWRYPVVFCVKRPGEAKKWFSTFSKKDLPR